jgi:hypothetical protein
MSRTARVWAVLGALYALFFFWYTSFEGPLDADEIAAYSESLERLAGAHDPAMVARWKAFMETDTGDDFVMFNAIDLRDEPEQVGDVQPGETSEVVLARYTRPFMARALRNAAHPVFLGRAAAGALDVWGIEGAEEWSMGGLVRYRSRRDVMEQVKMLSESDDRIHQYKIAAMAKTIAYPIDPYFTLGDPRIVLALLFGTIGFALQARAKA